MLLLERYAPFLGVPKRPGGTLVPVERDAPCPWCCHWSYPLTVAARSVNGVAVPLAYAEWLVYDWHVRQHQRGAPLA